MKKFSNKIKDQLKEAIKESIKSFIFQRDAEEARFRKRVRALDVPVMKTHMAELDPTFTNEADGNQERIKNFNHAIERCYDALDRLEKNTFGACEKCGSKIPLKRLLGPKGKLLGPKGVPFTRHCVPCKTEIEAAIKRNTKPGSPRQTYVT